MESEDQYAPPNGYVYFIAGDDSSSKPLCKVGWSGNPWKRLCQIQTAAPFQCWMLAVLPEMGKDEERFYHEYFKSEHIYGEWFFLRGTLLNFLLENRMIWLSDSFYRAMYQQVHGVQIEPMASNYETTEEEGITADECEANFA